MATAFAPGRPFLLAAGGAEGAVAIWETDVREGGMGWVVAGSLVLLTVYRLGCCSLVACVLAGAASDCTF